MSLTTELFLAYVSYKGNPRGPRLTFSDYVSKRPDLKSMILVSMIAADNGIDMARRKVRS